MKERPILFSAPMVRALLDGSKTQTRRICKSQPYPNGFGFAGGEILCNNDYLPPSAMLMDCRRGGVSYTTSDLEGWTSECPYGQPEERLWVRETWMPDAPRNGEWPDVAFYGCGMSPLDLIPECYRHPWHCLHRATYEGCELIGWKPSIHMPRWASRINLEIEGVFVERLLDISEADAIAEGIERLPTGAWKDYSDPTDSCADPISSYRTLWESINGFQSSKDNPWVWVVEFRRLP